MRILCDDCTQQNKEDRACSLDNTFKPNLTTCDVFFEKSDMRKREDWHHIQFKPSRRIR